MSVRGNSGSVGRAVAPERKAQKVEGKEVAGGGRAGWGRAAPAAEGYCGVPVGVLGVAEEPRKKVEEALAFTPGKRREEEGMRPRALAGVLTPGVMDAPLPSPPS